MEDGRTRPGAGRHLTSVDRPRHRRRRPTRAQLLHRVDVLAQALADLRAELVDWSGEEDQALIETNPASCDGVAATFAGRHWRPDSALETT